MARASLLMISLVLASCAPPLRVDAVTPVPAVPGGALTVTGEGFAAGLALTLQASVDIQLQDLEVASGTEARGIIPLAAPAGTYDLVARLGAATATLPDAVRVADAGLRAHFIDVGQGDGTLIIAPGGETLLIDGGPPEAGEALREAIETFAGGRLDAVVLTHRHADHLGALVTVLAGDDGVAGTNDDRVPAQRFGYVDDAGCDSALCARARSLLAWPLTVPAPGDTIALGDAEIVIEASDGDVGFGPIAGVDGENERSVVVRAAFAGRSLLVNGDLTGGGEGEADVEGPLSRVTGPVDVLRAGHHGSDTSSSAAALAAWQPRAVILSLGTDNQFCHPSDDAFARIVAAGATVYATGAGVVDDLDRCGAPTAWPPSARPGLGTITLDIGVDGSMTIQGEPL